MKQHRIALPHIIYGMLLLLLSGIPSVSFAQVSLDTVLPTFYDPARGYEAPYVAGTCEPKTLPADLVAALEPLIINLREVDCTTFVEYVTACILGDVELPDANDAQLQLWVEKLRYRDGVRGNYATRKHYFSEWISDASANGWLTELTPQLKGCQPLSKRFSFMTAHPDAYPQLKQSAALLAEVKAVETKLNEQSLYYVPKDKIEQAYPQLQHGDIVTFVTDREGLDVQHVGFVWHPSPTDTPRLLHASSALGHVTISKESLAGYARGAKRCVGIRVARIIGGKEVER